MSKPIIGSLDTNGTGMKLNQLLTQFNIVPNIQQGEQLIRTGKITLNDQRVKDILFKIEPGVDYKIKIQNRLVALITLI